MNTLHLDSIIFSLQPFGGASVYWRNLVSCLRRHSQVNVLETISPKAFRGFPVFSFADIFHSSHFRVPVASPSKVVSTVHDLTYELGFLGSGPKAKLNILERRHSYFNADALICISHNTKSDLLSVYPELAGCCPIYVAHHGGSLSFLPDCDLPSAYETPYILYIGHRRNHKNFSLALMGFFESKVWRDDYILVCTGPPFTEEERTLFKNLSIFGSIVHASVTSDAMLRRLYQDALCLLYTSRYEGFGLPLVEAMSLGCPVVAANTSCIPEIIEDSGILVGPDSPEDVARAIKSLISADIRGGFVNAGLRRSRHFSWDLSASIHLDAYSQLMR